MDNRNAFERQLADEIDYEVGPPRTVDALAIARQAKTKSPKWRFSNMSTALKFAAAAGVLTVAGTALLLVVPARLEPDGVMAPPGAEEPTATPTAEAAESEAQAVAEDTALPVYVTATIGDSLPLGMPESSFVDGAERVRGLEREGPIDSSDPRLAGSLLRVISYDSHQVSFTEDVGIQTDLWRIENEAGAWSGESTGFGHFGEVPAADVIEISTVILFGEGAYDGLTAYLIADWAPAVGADVQGAIFSGPMPPAPDGFSERE